MRYYRFQYEYGTVRYYTTGLRRAASIKGPLRTWVVTLQMGTTGGQLGWRVVPTNVCMHQRIAAVGPYQVLPALPVQDSPARDEREKLSARLGRSAVRRSFDGHLQKSGHVRSCLRGPSSTDGCRRTPKAVEYLGCRARRANRRRSRRRPALRKKLERPRVELQGRAKK